MYCWKFFDADGEHLGNSESHPSIDAAVGWLQKQAEADLPDVDVDAETAQLAMVKYVKIQRKIQLIGLPELVAAGAVSPQPETAPTPSPAPRRGRKPAVVPAPADIADQVPQSEPEPAVTELAGVMAGDDAPHFVPENEHVAQVHATADHNANDPDFRARVVSHLAKTVASYAPDPVSHWSATPGMAAYLQTDLVSVRTAIDVARKNGELTAANIYAAQDDLGCWMYSGVAQRTPAEAEAVIARIEAATAQPVSSAAVVEVVKDRLLRTGKTQTEAQLAAYVGGKLRTDGVNIAAVLDALAEDGTLLAAGITWCVADGAVTYSLKQPEPEPTPEPAPPAPPTQTPWEIVSQGCVVELRVGDVWSHQVYQQPTAASTVAERLRGHMESGATGPASVAQRFLPGRAPSAPEL